MTINPKITYIAKSQFIKKGDILKETNLYSALKECESRSNHNYNNQKGREGSILRYLSPTAYPTTYKCDGLIWVDIDNNEVTDQVIDNGEKLIQYLPNLLAIKKSASGNIHAFLYDEEFVTDEIDTSKYEERSLLYVATFAAAVKKVIGVDFRFKTGALDGCVKGLHQQIFMAPSGFFWNPYCAKFKWTKELKERLKAEYHTLFPTFTTWNNAEVINNSLKDVRGKDTTFNSWVPRIIDRNINICGYTGNDARWRIVANIIGYCGGDEDKAKEVIMNGFDDPTRKEMMGSLKTLIRNNKWGLAIKPSIIDWLFKKDDDVVELEEGRYLNDVLNWNKEDVDNLTGTISIISNTNTGKTEWAKRMLLQNDNVLVVMSNKALRDGKKDKDTAPYVFENTDKDVNKNKAFITIDSLCRWFTEEEMKNKVVICDETHLWEDYISMRERRNVIGNVIKLLDSAKCRILMTATPKADHMIWEDMKCYKFIKRQKQKVKVNIYTLDVDKVEKANDISHTTAVYNWIKNNIVEKLYENGEQLVIYSDNGQENWKSYVLRDFIERNEVGLYRSRMYTADCKKKIDEENMLIYPITLATRYLGVGLEIKKDKNGDDVKRGHIVINLNEGFDIKFVEQCIGRFRNAEEIVVYAVQSRIPNSKKWGEDDKEMLGEYYNTLYEMCEDGEYRLNGAKALLLNAWDMDGDSIVKRKVGLLLANNMVHRYDYADLRSIKLFEKTLPYKEVEVTVKDVKLNRKAMEDNKFIKKNEESKLWEYVKSLSMMSLEDLMGMPVEEIVNHNLVPWEDAVRAYQILKVIKPVVKKGYDVVQMCDYFGGKISILQSEMKKLNLYYKWKNEKDTIIWEDKGDERLKEKIKEMESVVVDVEVMWKKEFLDRLGVRMYDIVVEDVFELVLDDDVFSRSDWNMNFNWSTYDECKMMRGKARKGTQAVANGKLCAKQYRVETDKLEKKYGLKKGMEVINMTETAKRYNINSETIRLWKKKGYIIELNSI